MDVPQIIRALGGPAKIAAQIGVPPNTVAYWAQRDSIPAKRWVAITKADGAAQAGVTMDLLASLAAEPAQ